MLGCPLVTERTEGATTRLAGIVLAAGGAARYGGPKQLACLGGLTLVTRAARQALACCPAGVSVVTGAYAAEVRAELAGEPVALVHNANWATGLASSIRCGLDGLPAHFAACLLMLGDQPAIDQGDLMSLVAAWASAPDRVAAARYAGTLGIPAVFPRTLWPSLRALSGDQGARALIASLSQVTEVPVPGAALDIDTPADLDALRRL
jgi:molybdenum cofactor cytidylyltransferase